ncbi:serine/threonine protein kinase [Nocardia terpenica]|uniref:serine/threonine-protein kinase n=1 Tax=Nocardia terpenica TaxID=455432 RepID=UPI001895283D|nr:serine/threonine-protein kinase [Nocardia terpenica]MBF6061743.1 serine/threonine protein kinase [Nocardia terpenica]MBF6107462.1 serine/threonine protein kinase [Nocardia terpenica]MBF6110163.1 serine/threonine protein kinase [Nocardia terpenica]MBF6122325.1 serine/threonine protein kinase [Nocardia terpenica]MBF6151499.1 serine/threonine protein kinase [Nocardia terpenica]
MAMSPGTIVGGYLVQRVLGAGGMGTVYLAKHPSLPRMDALKVLSPELSRDREFRARFEREGNLAAGLDHPNIVSVYNRGEEDGRLWIAMQYVDGTDAAAELTRDPRALTPLRALRIITEVGKGLDYAHRRGLLHRDVKPANFLLSDKHGDDERVLLTDFGVAKSTDDANELTQTGSFLATIAYASPEQLAGYPVDHRADIYSLACSFFKLLTGQNPYPSAQPAMVMMGHLHEPPPRPTAVRVGLSPAIDQVFARAMAKNPAERFGSCREFTDAATNALSPGHFSAPAAAPAYPIHTYEPTPHTDPRVAITVPAPGGAPQGKSKRLLLGGGVLGVVVVAAAAGIFWSTSDHGTTTAAPPTTPSTTTVAKVAPPTSVAQARQDNPAFQGQPMMMVDVTNGSDEFTPNVSVYLTPGPQANFLENIGFIYDSTYAAQNNEPSPRPIAKPDRYSAFNRVNGGYILVVRSDSKAGGGGQLGLPSDITSARATVIVVDDPATVAALRNWSDNSEKMALANVVPILRNRVK